MTARHLFGVFMVATMLNQTANADQTPESLSADFIEFLADMNEVTGDGFDNWLDDNSEDANHESGFKDEQYSEQTINE